MASGHEYRTNRPNTWLLRPRCKVKILLANPEPSTHGPSAKSRHKSLGSACRAERTAFAHSEVFAFCPNSDTATCVVVQPTNSTSPNEASELTLQTAITRQPTILPAEHTSSEPGAIPTGSAAETCSAF